MNDKHFVLAIHLTSWGYAFVLFDGPETPFDWMTTRIKAKEKNLVIGEQVEQLMDRYHPTVVVLDDVSGRSSLRSERVRRLTRALVASAKAADLRVLLYRRDVIRQAFSLVGARTKYEIAHAVARIIPAFKFRLPPVRKPWQSEDVRQSLFDAAALGLVYYVVERDHSDQAWFGRGAASPPTET